MFLSDTVARAIHTDRVRDLNRAERDHRLLAPEDAGAGASRATEPSVSLSALAGPGGRKSGGGSTSGLPA
jgi:hypothetical protein